MKKPLPYLLLIIIVSLLQSCNSETTEKSNTTTTKPNIIYILADDLGYGELGIYGQELIETPNLDALGKVRHAL